MYWKPKNFFKGERSHDKHYSHEERDSKTKALFYYYFIIINNFFIIPFNCMTDSTILVISLQITISNTRTGKTLYYYLYYFDIYFFKYNEMKWNEEIEW